MYVILFVEIDAQSLPVVMTEVKPSGTVHRAEGSDVVLECEVYGYPRDSYPPVWTWSGGDLQSDRVNIYLSKADLLTDAGSISSSGRVVSTLTIRNVTGEDSGEYTCSAQGNTLSVTIVIGKFTSMHLHSILVS